MIERYGVERFAGIAEAKLVDSDTDRGGRRELLSIAVPGDQPLAVLKVTCPSTGRLFHLRVPPWLRSCRQAAAWVAGFDNEADYNPVLES